MSTRQWMVLVALVAAWLTFVMRADRLRKVAGGHMRQFEHRVRVNALATQGKPGGGAQGDQRAAWELNRRAAWHLRMATEYNGEADFVEAFQVALLLTLIVLGAALVFRKWRRRRAPSLAR